MLVKEIVGQKFYSHSKGVDKFHDTSALGLSWRPGRDPVSYEIRDCLIDGSKGDEGLKLSFCQDVYVVDSKIIGGTEDCVDIVRGRNIQFVNCEFVSNNTKQHITIKGGAKDISILNCKFINDYSKWWDGACVDLGNWTDYDDVTRPMVRNVEIKDCKMVHMKQRLLARVLHSKSPTVTNSDGKIFKVPRIALIVFWLGQRLGYFGKRRRMAKDDLQVYDIEL
jgi:hypothetical protein